MAVKQLPKISPIPEPPNRLVGDQERFDTMTFNSLTAQEKMVNEDLNKTLIPALNEFAVDVNASVDAAALSERNAHDSEEVAKRKAGEASGSAGAAKVSEDNAKVSETNALASKNAAALSAESARIAAEAARDEAQDLANVGYVSEGHAGLAKVDGKTTQADAGGVITAKDVAIGGDLGDLASARGQIGAARELGNNVDYNTVTEAGFYLINATGGVNGPIVGSAAFLQVFYSKKDAFTKNLYQIVYAYSSARERMFIRQYRIASNDWSSWSEIVSSSCIGDGLTVNNGIISVPEYEGATASAAGTSGLVPPAAAGKQESFLTGGGEYKPALSTSGGTVTGNLSIKNLLDLIGTAPATEQELGLYHLDKNGNIMGGHDFVHNVNNIKAAQMYARNSSGLISSLGVYVEEDGTRYTLSSHNLILTSDVEIGRLYADGVRLITFSGTKGSPGLMMRYSPDTGELYLDGRAVHGKADTAGNADTATYANSAGSALIAAPAVQWVVNLSGPQITVPPGGTYNVVCICFNDSGGKGAVKHYPDTAGGTVIPNAPTDYMVAGLCARVQKEG